MVTTTIASSGRTLRRARLAIVVRVVDVVVALIRSPPVVHRSRSKSLDPTFEFPTLS
jgi:hypothetical protein